MSSTRKSKLAAILLPIALIIYFMVSVLPGQEGILTENDGFPAGSSPGASGSSLAVTFIDVGQGDAILVQTASKNILIDGGDRGNIVVDYLREQQVDQLDLVIGTHPHADHIGGGTSLS